MWNGMVMALLRSGGFEEALEVFLEEKLPIIRSLTMLGEFKLSFLTTGVRLEPE